VKDFLFKITGLVVHVNLEPGLHEDTFSSLSNCCETELEAWVLVRLVRLANFTLMEHYMFDSLICQLLNRLETDCLLVDIEFMCGGILAEDFVDFLLQAWPISE